MKRTQIFLAVMWSVFSGVAITSQNIKNTAYITPIRALFETPSLYDGKEVIIKGEVIGDIIRDGTDYWINIKDENGFIGVIINSSQKEKIRYTGRYKMKGDIVKVSGVYHLHCPLHLGERDIHAEKFEIIENGYEVQEVMRTDKLIGSVVLGMITIFILLYSHKKSIHRDIYGQQS
ncbi:MAG: hypothetical protein NC824_04485 [Candidatus Omnitrophica bacterium]|nr:hypothetical protein [Candidatus Omnitrophota bacterium]